MVFALENKFKTTKNLRITLYLSSGKHILNQFLFITVKWTGRGINKQEIVYNF